MNSLSWLLYLADVSGSLGIMLGFLGGVWAIIYLLGCIATHADNCDYPWPWWKVILPLSLVFFASLFPSQKTIYFIAASEYGEVALSSPTGQLLLANINAKLEGYLKNNTVDIGQ